MTAARTKRQLQGDQSREEILDAATRLMAARGYAGTSVSDIARESGLPASSIYWHFASKTGVLTAVMERGAARFFGDLEAADPQPGGPPPRSSRASWRAPARRSRRTPSSSGCSSSCS